jgi:hypothetical protein
MNALVGIPLANRYQGVSIPYLYSGRHIGEKHGFWWNAFGIGRAVVLGLLVSVGSFLRQAGRRRSPFLTSLRSYSVEAYLLLLTAE